MTGQKARGSIFTVIFSRVRENLSRPYQKNRESESVRALRERSLRLRMKRRAGTGLPRDRAWAFPGSPCCTTCANDTHVQLNYRSASASSHLPVGRSSAHCHTRLPPNGASNHRHPREAGRFQNPFLWWRPFLNSPQMSVLLPRARVSYPEIGRRHCTT